jgi:ATP-dependent protease ClpP protease subunit
MLVAQIIAAILTLCLGGEAFAQAPAIPAIDPARTVAVVGPIVEGNILPLGNLLLSWATKDPQTPASIILNSPGGEVTTGFMFVNQMEMAKSLGLTINCYVPGMAASMAFTILTHCSNRFALNHAFLLWHRVRVQVGGGLFSSGEVFTAPIADALARDLARLDALILAETLDAVDMPAYKVRYHFEHETLHVATQLADESPGFITASDNIPGLTAALFNKKIPGPTKKESQDMLKSGQIVYIWKGVAH